MGLKLVLGNLRNVSDDVWETELAVEELGVLPTPDSREGEVNVLAVMNPSVDGDGRVELDLEHAHILNLGESARTLVIALRDQPLAAPAAQPRDEDVVTPLPTVTPLPGRGAETRGVTSAEDNDNDNAGPASDDEDEAVIDEAGPPAQAEEAKASRSQSLPTGFWEVREIRERREW